MHLKVSYINPRCLPLPLHLAHHFTRIPLPSSCAGTLPPSWAQLSSLYILWLADNALTGGLPPELRNAPALQDIFVSGNRLSGPLPDPSDLPSGLTSLRIAGNRLSGKRVPAMWPRRVFVTPTALLSNARRILACLMGQGAHAPEGAGHAGRFGEPVDRAPPTCVIPALIPQLPCLGKQQLHRWAVLPMASMAGPALQVSSSGQSSYISTSFSAGTFPSWASISLISIDVSRNKLTGPLPSLPNLPPKLSSQLDLHGNQFSGEQHCM